MDTFRSHTEDIGHRIAALGVALGIDWDNQVEVRGLAQEAIEHAAATVSSASEHKDSRLLLKAEIFGLAALMLKEMQGSAERGFLTHGGPSWRSFGKALWQEYERTAPGASSQAQRR